MMVNEYRLCVASFSNDRRHDRDSGLLPDSQPALFADRAATDESAALFANLVGVVMLGANSMSSPLRRVNQME